MPWPTDEKTGLTNRQKAFVDIYIANGYNGKEAALTAGYSERSAHVIASENLSKPKLKAYMRERMQELSEKMGLTPEYTLRNLKDGIDKSQKHIEQEVTYIDNLTGEEKGKKLLFNSDAANTLHKFLDQAHKVLDLYPREEKQVDTNDLNNKDELLDKCRKDA